MTFSFDRGRNIVAQRESIACRRIDTASPSAYAVGAMIVELPEPFRSALARGDAASVVEAPATSPEALYARGLARAQLGREAGARADFEAARPRLGDLCDIESALVDVRSHTAVEDALVRAEAIASRAKPGSWLLARSEHVRGLALGKLRQPARAAESLVQAATAYESLDDTRGQAEVFDTLGMLYAAEGQLELASGYFALSVGLKGTVGDLYGIALTLGNLGRLHLRAGRYREALASFSADLRIATRLGDDRGRARMLNDIARARLGLGDLDGADAALREGLELARSKAFADIEFFVRKDTALSLVARFRRDGAPTLVSARRELDAAESVLAPGAEPYLRLVLEAARGEIALAAGDADALHRLESAARGFAEADLPDHEIATLVLLAEALAARGLKATAERCLTRALARARKDGYARYLAPIREAMERLEVVEGTVEEHGRLDLGRKDLASPDGYSALRLVGRGAFGDVHRALDPRANRIVAIKRLRLEDLYDPGERRRLVASTRLEMEAASRIRHPGIARVHAVGVDAEGRTYVVQEFIEGEPLRKRMPRDNSADLCGVLSCAGKIAAALEELHAHGIVHRDLKPENVMIRTPGGDPVLIDFGIAYVPRLGDAFGEGAVVGTFAYMAPEQLRGQPVDGRTDVYALGVLVYEWLAGVRPIVVPEGDFKKIAATIEQRPPVPLRDYRPNAPASVAGLVERLLAKNRKARPDAAQACREFEAILGGLGPPAGETRIQPTSRE